MFSAHDTTIAALLETLNPNHWRLAINCLYQHPCHFHKYKPTTDHSAFRAVAPPYASALFLELYVDDQSNPFVQVRYKNHSELIEWEFSGQILLIPGCSDTMCAFSLFNSSLAAFIPGNWTQECALPSASSRHIPYGFHMLTGHRTLTYDQ